jgi:hypothetical protein
MHPTGTEDDLLNIFRKLIAQFIQKGGQHERWQIKSRRLGASIQKAYDLISPPDIVPLLMTMSRHLIV